MKKISTVGEKQIRNFPDQKLTIGLDLGACTERSKSLNESADGRVATGWVWAQRMN
jgi:hypothetical protein